MRGKVAGRRGRAAHDKAIGLVNELARLWERDLLSTRTAAKILRRRGIHPWSQLPAIQDIAWYLAAWDLGAPGWIMQAREVGDHGFSFVRPPKGVRLPKGLVVHEFEVVDAPHLVRLPRRLQCFRLAAIRCRGLETLPTPAPGLRILHGEDCPRLRGIPAALPGLERLILKRCAALRRVPMGHDLEALTLSVLPALRALPRGRTIGSLRVWSCRNLEDLGGLRVTGRLWLHGNTALRALPDCADEVRGRVRDCPGLVDPVWPRNSYDFTFEAGEGPSFLPSPEAPPAGQGMSPRALPGLAEAEGESWPWPPEGHGLTPIPEPIDLMMKGLGLGLLDRARCLAGLGRGLPWALRALLLGTEAPPAALGLGVELLKEAHRARDLGAASLVCLELEDLGLGALSAGLLLEKAIVQWLRPVLGQDWCRHFHRNYEPLAGLGQSARVLPGPLVVGAEPTLYPLSDPIQETRVVECPCLARIEGPLWASRSLWFRDCPDLEALPGLMVVQGDLVVEDCPSLLRFPGRLEVDGDLVLAGLPRLQAQVCRARVGGSIRMEGVAGLRLEVAEGTPRPAFPTRFPGSRPDR